MTVKFSPAIEYNPPIPEMPTAALPCAQTFAPPSTMPVRVPASLSDRRPALQVRSGSSRHTFEPGRDVVVGRDPQADITIASPLVSRAHLLLRFTDGQWMAIDNGSLNGVFANGLPVSVVPISDGQTLNIGEADGPPLTFGVERHPAQRPPGPATSPPAEAHRRGSAPGTITIGRTPDNDVVVADVLVSRHHAMLVPTDTGMEIRDAGTLNGTFVNSVRTETAPLREGDVVTIGNVDLLLSGGTLVGRS